ncbi:hypothetical protein GCM10025857_26570 [Alicyclobacillus contaminans]|uniref:flagellar protein FlgN n=1 Tax=Alicyclobacillus contaminans TaxID=392016 RepID=UPI00040BEA55|nr:flagellar protein FlgN [Alicyclobacillus contaminans]GMA51300.1 hypothetical protein GCM10025857_26570 [Alicyclobacillus contaminans]
MRPQVSVLSGVLEQLVAAHKRLLAVCQQHTVALVNRDIARIHSTTQKIEVETAGIRALEASRQQLAADVARGLGLDTENITLSRLLPHLNPQEATRLQRSATQLGALMQALAETNERNHRLLEQSLQYLTKTVEWVADSLGQTQYGPQVKRVVGGYMIDVKA